MGKRRTSKDDMRQKPTEKLKNYCRDLYDDNCGLIIAIGLPSTGKTISAIEAGVEQVLKGRYDYLVIIRPVITLSTGFLPGVLLEKMAPYISQSEEYTNGCSQTPFMELVLAGKIKVVPADQLQGRRFRHAFIVADEMQNVHKSQTFKIMSRLGEDSKYVFLGDISLGQESDKIKRNSMLHYVVNKFRGEYYCSVHSFYDEENDLLGDERTKQIIRKLIPDFVNRQPTAYEELQEKVKKWFTFARNAIGRLRFS